MLFRRSMLLGGIPSACMAISTYIGLGKEVPIAVAGALQHFAAGVLLCTVATELLPTIVQANGVSQNLAAVVGFFLGVTVLILLGMFEPSPQDRDLEDQEETGSEGLPSPSPGQKQLHEMKFFIAGRKFRQRQSINNFASTLGLKRAKSLSSLDLATEGHPLISPLTKSPRHACYMDEEKKLSSVKDAEDEAEQEDAATPPAKRFPVAFVAAVAIDSSLDGLLIGIASAAGPSAGPMMSASLSVEMGFLGLTLATTLSGQSFPRAAIGALVGPVCLVLAAGVGGALADSVSHSPVAFVGMLSFGASSLLFMVAEELLLDAHERGEHVWWVDLQLYTGFFASILAGKFVTR